MFSTFINFQMFSPIFNSDYMRAGWGGAREMYFDFLSLVTSNLKKLGFLLHYRPFVRKINLKFSCFIAHSKFNS